MRVHENTAHGGILVQGHCYYITKGPKDQTETRTNFWKARKAWKTENARTVETLVIPYSVEPVELRKGTYCRVQTVTQFCEGLIAHPFLFACKCSHSLPHFSYQIEDNICVKPPFPKTDDFQYGVCDMTHTCCKRFRILDLFISRLLSLKFFIKPVRWSGAMP